MTKTILITGGAGYIGSHIAFLLTEQGYKVIIIDQLVHDQKIGIPNTIFINQDFANKDLIRTLAKKHQIDAVLHLAASTSVNKSIYDPLNFYDNNVVKSLSLLELLVELSITKFIFASSCAVYGNAHNNPIHENQSGAPISPYGKSKYMIESALEDCARAYGISYIIFRYFNVAGALAGEPIYKSLQLSSLLIPSIIDALQNDHPFTLFGTDHPTSDGTAVRDYVHVMDVAQAHLLGLEYLDRGGTSDCFNLGSGHGTSVHKIIETAEKIIGKKLTVIKKASRTGDPSALIADISKARSVLCWQPCHSDVETIIESAYRASSSENSLNDLMLTLPSLSTTNTPSEPVAGR